GGAAFSIVVDFEERLVVVQEVQPKLAAPSDEVIDAIRRRISEEHEIAPYGVVLIKPGTVPKTSSGKIQRRLCRSLFMKRALDVVAGWIEEPQNVDSSSAKETIELDRGSVERWLLSRIASLLRASTSAFDIDEPIARFGLDSLAAIELIHNVDERFGVEVP